MQLFGRPFKPMLSGKANLMALEFPVAASTKLDGVRCVILDQVPLSRSLKPIRNKRIQAALTGFPYILDGELLAVDGNFQQTTTAVMAADSELDWEYHVFDFLDPTWDEPKPFAERHRKLIELDERGYLPPQCVVVPQDFVYTRQDLEELHAEHIANGHEGTMVRSPQGTYKFGRSTTKEGTLLKIKMFADAEAKVVGYEELLHNDNEATVNALGLTERSGHKDNKRASGMLGALIVELDGQPEITFKIGTGFTEEQRIQLWQEREALIGSLAKYKYFDFGIKERPRHPVWLGFRHPDDL